MPHSAPHPSPEQIAEFDAAHGIGAFEKCRTAERLVRLARRGLGDSGRVTAVRLERQGIKPELAAAFCLLLYGPPPTAPVKVRGAQRWAPR